MKLKKVSFLRQNETYFASGDIDSARIYFYKAKSIADFLQDSELIAQSMNNLVGKGVFVVIFGLPQKLNFRFLNQIN